MQSPGPYANLLYTTQSIRCNICQYLFDNKSNLNAKTHTHTHTKLLAAPYACACIRAIFTFLSHECMLYRCCFFLCVMFTWLNIIHFKIHELMRVSVDSFKRSISLIQNKFYVQCIKSILYIVYTHVVAYSVSAFVCLCVCFCMTHAYTMAHTIPE